MSGKGRTTELALVGVAALVLGLSALSPVFAWHVASFSSTIYCENGSTWAPCTSSQLAGISTPIKDEASLQLSANGKPYGTLSFFIYSGGSSSYFNDVDTHVCTINSGASLVWTDSANPQAVTSASQQPSSQPFTSSVVSSLTAGSYFFYVSYSGTGSGGYPAGSLCEPFTAVTFPPPPTVPQFPLGIAVLLGLAIPALFLAKSKFSGKQPTLSV